MSVTVILHEVEDKAIYFPGIEIIHFWILTAERFNEKERAAANLQLNISLVE